MQRFWIFALALLPLGMNAGALFAKSFAPITASERELTSVPGHPEAAAVVLFRKGEFQMRDPARREQFSTLTVRTRIKILTEEGRDLAEFKVYHGRFQRLARIKARTVLPDGTVVPVGEDSQFETALTSSRRWIETTIAFPQVEVGAILDFETRLRWDSMWYLDPWLFQDSIPTLYSEIVYHVPEVVSFKGWQRDPTQIGIEREIIQTGRGRDLKVWVNNAPPILDEPYSFPKVDLTTRFILAPVAIAGEPLLHSWRFTCDLIQDGVYDDALRGDGAVRKKARELTKGLSDPEAKAREIYRFLRDEIDIAHSPGVTLGQDRNTGVVLEEGRGDYAERALMLRSMLEAVKIPAELIWTADRDAGMIDPSLPTFTWFDSILVRIELGGKEVYLDPTSRYLAFGQIDYDHEGTQALLFHTKKPEVITLPVTPASENTRRAELDLTLDEEGRVVGTGSATLTGHRALVTFRRRGANETAEEDWTSWLEESYPGFEISEVAAEGSPQTGDVRVTWALRQLDDEVLGDETSLTPSRPFGPRTQPFVLPTDRRRTPVKFNFTRRDESVIRLSWPEGWEIDVTPQANDFEQSVGRLATAIELDEEGRKLTYRRDFEVRGNQFLGRDEYTALRDLYGEVAKHDAQSLVLVRP